MSGQSPYMPAPPYTYQNNFPQVSDDGSRGIALHARVLQRDVRYAGNPSVETAMALNRRPSLLASYHSHFGSPERPALAPYVFSLAAPVSMGPHVDEHSKRARYPGTIPLSIDVKKVAFFRCRSVRVADRDAFRSNRCINHKRKQSRRAWKNRKATAICATLQSSATPSASSNQILR